MIPHFFIVGAMKSGTSTLYHILNTSSKIFLPKTKETLFLDRDDIYVHGRYFMFEFPEKYKEFNWQINKKELIREYKKYYKSASRNQLIGEASAHYMDSEKAARRIKELNENAKLIFILRNPVDRAYSHYWHWVKSGRAIYNFEDQVKYETPSIIRKGLYEKNIKIYLKYFSKEQMKFLVFEEFIKNMQSSINSILDFLNANDNIDVNEIDTHKNSSKTPRWIKGQLYINKIARYFLNKKMTSNLIQEENKNFKIYLFKLLRRINLNEKKYPSMKTSTRMLLQNYYKKENNNLEDLIGKKVFDFWCF